MHANVGFMLCGAVGPLELRSIIVILLYYYFYTLGSKDPKGYKKLS